jgi:hypothetical protein
MTSGKQKIAQDVTVFKGIAQSMPPKALFHLLRGAASASIGEFLVDDESKAIESNKANASTSKEGRRVRFEPDRNNENGFVKCFVHKIPRVSDPSLWWQREDFNRIRREAGTVAENYRRYHKDYIKTIVQLLDFYTARHGNSSTISQDSHVTSDDSPNQKQELINSFMQCMAKNGVARGLELHIVRAYGQKNKEHNDSVFTECDRDITNDHAIRRACLVHSRVSLRMANLFAKYDTKEALTCLVTPWGPWAVNNGGRPPMKPTRSSDPIIPLSVTVD